MAHKKVNISFKISGKSTKYKIIPPWCSSGKLSENRKLPPKREIQSSYPLRESIWEYLHDKNTNSCSKTPDRKRDEVDNCMKRSKITLLLLFIMVGLTAALWKFYHTPCLELSAKIIEKTKMLWFAWKNSSASKQCCHEMKHLALELSRAELIFRNTIRYRMTMMSASQVKMERGTTTNSYTYISGASATKGSSTEEWSGRVNLWGLIPLWRTASPPDTVLALRRPKPADCWPFRGSTGALHIKLPTFQLVHSISIEHVRPDTARSAPKQFIAYGFLTNGTHVKLVHNEYRSHGPAKQYYSINLDAPMTGVILHVLTNQGNAKYTCIYRVHLYGK